MTYDHKAIEKKWQEKWEQDKLYTTPDAVEGKENFYILVEFPYPSGNLHIGHWYAFSAMDIFARYQRMLGKNVLFPIGFDSFGLPAENAAIKRSLDPKEWTYSNIDFMRTQLKSMGATFDWSREVRTSDPSYYKWTQYIFTKFLEKGLAYRANEKVNWCPSCNTILAAEQVINGECERCGAKVEKREMKTWMLKITDYADRLIDDLSDVGWPDAIKEAQINWIGRSEGAEFDFQIDGSDSTITVFTTRPDTFYGVTYLVVAPEHPLITELAHEITNTDEVEAYKKEALNKSELDRLTGEKEKTGVELKGIEVIHPATGEKIPVFVADYVLGSYGTGAVMAVPAHDERDFEFAKKYDLPIKQVIVPCADDPYNPPQEGFEEVKRDTVVVHLRNNETGKFAILDWHGSLEGITTAIMGGIEEGQTSEEAALAEIQEEAAITGVRIIKSAPWITAARYCASHKSQNRCAHSWVFLAEVDNLDAQKEIPEHEQALHTLVWVDESEVMDRLTPVHQKQMWHILNNDEALTDPGYLINSAEFDEMDSEAAAEKITEKFGRKKTTYRLRDWSVGRQRYWGCPIPVVYDPEGKPHSVPEEHLPWALPEDVDHTPTGEPPLARSEELKKRTIEIFGEGWTPEVETMDTFVDSSWYYLRYLDPKNEVSIVEKEKAKSWMPVDVYSGGAEHTTLHLLYSRFFFKALVDLGLAEGKEPFAYRFNRSLILGPDGQKMSKSKGNVVDPDEQVARVGSDTVRSYFAFMGPYNVVTNYPWDLGGIAGIRRFLERVWKLSSKISNDVEGVLLDKTISRVGESIEAFKFNTALSSLMEYLNAVGEKGITSEQYQGLLKLLAPFAPHLAEELWNEVGGEGSVHTEVWPRFDASLLEDELMKVAVQVNGKTRGVIEIHKGAAQQSALDQALELPEVVKWVEGKDITRVVYVPGRILNMIVSS